jgi:hypothetical protein
VDSEWSTVQAAYRAKNDMIKQSGWATLSPCAPWLSGWLPGLIRRGLPVTGRLTSLTKTGRNENWQKISQTTDPEVIDQLVREVGDERFYNFTDIPFFWFELEVTVNPEIIESWTYPGTSASKTSHWNLLKAAK